MSDVTNPGTPERGPWGPVATVALTLVVAGVFLLAQIALAIPYVLLTTAERSQTATTAAAASLEGDGLFLGLSETLSGTIALGLTILFVWMRRGPTVRAYLALKAVPSATALRWLLFTVLLGVVLEGTSYLARYPTVPEWMIKIYRSAGSLPLLFFALLVVAPIVEEIVFRGFLFEGLRHSRLGDSGAVLVASLVWAAIHLQYQAFYVGQVFCLGILLGAARVRTSSVVTPIWMHALFSGVAMLQVTLEVP